MFDLHTYHLYNLTVKPRITELGTIQNARRKPRPKSRQISASSDGESDRENHNDTVDIEVINDSNENIETSIVTPKIMDRSKNDVQTNKVNIFLFAYFSRCMYLKNHFKI